MGEATLVEQQIIGSRDLMKSLAARNIKLTSAVWNYDADANRWRFVVAAKEFDSFLPREIAKAYLQVVLALGDDRSLTAGDVHIVPTNHPLLQSAHMLASTGPDDEVRIHITTSMVNGMFIQDMVVLRAA